MFEIVSDVPAPSHERACSDVDAAAAAAAIAAQKVPVRTGYEPKLV